ncbi:hypothetical protein [Sulfurimonas sp. C5]|uniref:hypothetical protein n=1 Tax=Sulfurimonas sp. C5 TaxID=3036947 RepID=UPI00245399B0|nr:hypothetical protein [Sulfurimonas sp. C5]MDH4944495.1 hypothetical protein [Sulfurimonas sp. C5]
MSMQSLYCHHCKTEYQVRQEDLNLMRQHYGNFDSKEYRGGCFFKNLGRIKRSMKAREKNDG